MNWKIARNAFLFILFTFLAARAGCKLARADALRFSFGETWGVAWSPNGKQSEPAPQTLFGAGVGVRIADDWTWFGDLYAAVPRTAFLPVFRPTTGIVYRYGRFCVGGSLMYQWNPPYGNTDTSHLFGVTVGPGVFITKEIAFSFVVGYRTKFDDDGTIQSHVFSFGPSVTLLFPL